MHILEDLVGKLGEVEEGFISDEHDVKGHFFRGVEIKCLKSCVFGKMEIYKFEKIS